MKVAAITGYSGSGKSTLISALIAHYCALGARVAAIKHTHHPLNEEDRGDSRKFRLAGADPVILVAAEGVVVHRAGGVVRATWNTPEDLLELCVGAEVVLVEGFKSIPVPWPAITIVPEVRRTVAEVAAELDRIWRHA